MSKDSVSSVSIDYHTSAAEDIRQQTKLSVGTSDTNNEINNAKTVVRVRPQRQFQTQNNQMYCGPVQWTTRAMGSGSGQQMTFANLLKVFVFFPRYVSSVGTPLDKHFRQYSIKGNGTIKVKAKALWANYFIDLKCLLPYREEHTLTLTVTPCVN